MALLAINLLSWLSVRAAIASSLSNPVAMPLPTMDHPSVTEFWIIWMPGIVSWGMMAVATVGFVILAGPMHYSLQKVPLGWYYLLSMPSFGLTAALVLADLYYFVVWS